MPAQDLRERMDDAFLARAHRALRRRDPVLGAVVRRIGPPKLQRRGGVRLGQAVRSEQSRLDLLAAGKGWARRG